MTLSSSATHSPTASNPAPTPMQARAEAAAFDIDPSTGQLITKAPLDTEGNRRVPTR